MPKRLFIFASWDRDAIVDDYVVYYVRALAELGDVIFYMDNDAAPEELDKVRPFTIYAHAQRHSSYDFGSHKRAYQWADDQGILNHYDFLYLCNDSCFGPFRPLGPALEHMESKNADWFGFVAGTWSGIRHIQSWFVGMRPSVFLADWWKRFIAGITQESDKDAYIHKYEFFVSRLAAIFGASFYARFEDVRILTECDQRLAEGMPFIKRLGYFDKVSKDFASRTRALLMLEPQQREMVLKYMRRINPVTAWLVMHPGMLALIYKLKQCLRGLLEINIGIRKELVIRVFGILILGIGFLRGKDFSFRVLGIALIKIGPSKRKVFAVRVLGIPVLYKNRLE